MGGILGSTSYYCFPFLLRSDLHGPLKIFVMLMTWESVCDAPSKENPVWQHASLPM
jgi:hypothetical protein